MPAMNIYIASEDDLDKMGRNLSLRFDEELIEGVDFIALERIPSLTEFQPGQTGYWKNKPKPQKEETKRKIKNTLTGVKHSKERNRNNSLGHMGIKHSEETKAKMSATRKQQLWYTNGVINVRRKECPEGFWRGQTR